MSLGEKIKKERQRQGFSYKSLAVKAEISWRTIYLVESGKVSPSIKTLEKIADGLGLSAVYFLS